MSLRGAARPLSGHAPRECEIVLGHQANGARGVTLYAWGGYNDGRRIPFGNNVEILRQLLVDLQKAVDWLEEQPPTSC